MLTAFLIIAVQSAVDAVSYDYTIKVYNQTGQHWQYCSVIVNDGASADFTNVSNGSYVEVNYYEVMSYVSVVYTTPSGYTITRDNLPIVDGAYVYVR